MRINYDRGILPAVILAVMLLKPPAVHADTVTVPGTMGAGVNDTFSIEFYTNEPAKYLYSNATIPFTNIDSTKYECYADNRAANDNKNDTGVVCKSNFSSTTWYLKMGVSATSSPAFPLENFKFYLGQPWNLTRGQSADGTLAYSGWTSVPTGSTVIYTAGTYDKNNMDLGTLSSFTFKIIPIGLIGGRSYSMSITYTLSASP